MSLSPLAGLIVPVQDALARLDARVRGLPTLRLGTVTSVGPTRVQLDGDTAPMPATPRTLVPVSPGDRVQVAHQGRVITVLGKVGGGGAIAGKAWREAGNTVPHDTIHALNLNQVEGPLTGGVTSNGGGLVVPRTGWYQVSAGVQWGTIGGGGHRQLRIRTGAGVSLVVAQTDAVINLAQTVSIAAYLTAGTLLTASLYQNSGGSVGINPTWKMPFITVLGV